MSIPSRRGSASLLLSLDPPDWHLRHSRAVAETAAWLALRAVEAGAPVDRRLVEAAALLHDVDKLPTVRASLNGRAHAEGSARWLAERGHPELGPAIVGHPVSRLADGAWFEEWLATASPEALIVAYADKRAGQKLEPMAARFESWVRRYPPEERAAAPGSGNGWSADTVAAVRRRAGELETRVCALAGVAPGDVRRLGWTARAFGRARVGS
jgi:putative nucleotidyltransferase with HDIG domain